MKTFKILGLLLTYPQTEIQQDNTIIERLHKEALLQEKYIARIKRFLENRKQKELMEIQEEYVDTFDRGRAHSLHLFEHIHGESRNRGQAMVNLSETYAQKGLYIANNELPDYLPLFMEYLSYCPLKEASSLLGEAIDVIAMIRTKLTERQSPYADVIAAIETLSDVKPDKKKLKYALRNAPKNPTTYEELDEEWREAEAFAGAPEKNTQNQCQNCNTIPNTIEQINKMIGGAST